MNTDLISKTSGWRGSRDIWVQAAYEALLDGGIDAVKGDALATGSACHAPVFTAIFPTGRTSWTR
jgi:hypothetical protein